MRQERVFLEYPGGQVWEMEGVQWEVPGFSFEAWLFRMCALWKWGSLAGVLAEQGRAGTKRPQRI